MPKTKQYESVLHDWVHSLPFQMQAVLLTAIRGADGMPKHDNSKPIVRYLRGVVIKPAGNWLGHNDNDFMWGDWKLFPEFVINLSKDHDNIPHHFLMHLIHAGEVIAYHHPCAQICTWWMYFYSEMCYSFHMNMETNVQLDLRLNDFGQGWHNSIESTAPLIPII
jgi:hypothetical protein